MVRQRGGAMALSAKVQAELLAERARKVRDRDEADEVIKGIDILLRLGSARAGGNGDSSVGPTGKDSALPNITEVGLREAVRRALASLPDGGRPAQVTAVLKQWRFPETGSKHPLSLRVSNDLNRMRSVGMVTRDDDGVYRIAKGARNGSGQLDALVGRGG